MKLENKICLVAGASSGMGRQTAIAAALEGATVIVAARRLELCEAVVDDIKRSGGQGLPLRLDGTDPESVQVMIDRIESEFGCLDCVFNNIGHTFGHSSFHETPLERWHNSIKTNLDAIFYLLRAQIPLVLKSGGGSIVNNSSTAGLQGVKAMADYSAAKWGLIGLTRSIALEYAAQNIRCNVIAPGIIATEAFDDIRKDNVDLFETLLDAIPSRSFGEMKNIADTVTWLLSDEARYMTGATIPVDGGRTA